MDLYREAQENAMQDDWRVGAIISYLDSKVSGEYTCVRELCHKALSPNPDFPKDPGFTESKDIGMIMNKLPDWEPAGRHRIEGYGQQRSWRKKAKAAGEGPAVENWENLELPF